MINYKNHIAEEVAQ